MPLQYQNVCATFWYLFWLNLLSPEKLNKNFCSTINRNCVTHCCNLFLYSVQEKRNSIDIMMPTTIKKWFCNIIVYHVSREQTFSPARCSLTLYYSDPAIEYIDIHNGNCNRIYTLLLYSEYVTLIICLRKQFKYIMSIPSVKHWIRTKPNKKRKHTYGKKY